MRVWVEQDDGSQIDVTIAAQITFDALCNSLDAGSGLLDHPEVCALREMARALGLPPEDATPGQWETNWKETECAERMQHKVDCDSGHHEYVTDERERTYREGSDLFAAQVCAYCGTVRWDQVTR